MAGSAGGSAGFAAAAYVRCLSYVSARCRLGEERELRLLRMKISPEVTEERVLALAAGLESASQHPIGEALLAEAQAARAAATTEAALVAEARGGALSAMAKAAASKATVTAARAPRHGGNLTATARAALTRTDFHNI